MCYVKSFDKSCFNNIYFLFSSCYLHSHQTYADFVSNNLALQLFTLFLFLQFGPRFSGDVYRFLLVFLRCFKSARSSKIQFLKTWFSDLSKLSSLRKPLPKFYCFFRLLFEHESFASFSLARGQKCRHRLLNISLLLLSKPLLHIEVKFYCQLTFSFGKYLSQI